MSKSCNIALRKRKIAAKIFWILGPVTGFKSKDNRPQVNQFAFQVGVVISINELIPDISACHGYCPLTCQFALASNVLFRPVLLRFPRHIS